MPGRLLNFCMITTFYPPYHFGGEAMYLYRLVNALARLGHRVTVVHCRDSYRVLTSDGGRGEFPHHPNVTVHALHHPLGRLSPLVTYLSGKPGLKTRALDRIFASQDFDVVHFHLVTLFGPGVLRYGEGALRVYTTHDHWLVCPMYDLWKMNRELCESPSCLRCTLSYHRPPQVWRYTDLLAEELPRVDLFLSPSRSTIEQHRRRGFPYPMQHLPYFLPESEAEPAAAPGTTRARPYFLFVGRLVKIKGAETVIEVFRRKGSADLLLAGDGAYGVELRRRAEGIPNVRFLGRVHPGELRRLYAEAVAVIVPSTVYETFGFITLEALAQSTPVIARDLGAVAEVVRDTGGGLVYRTEEELRAAMELLQSDVELRNDLGRRGHEACSERYSEAKHLCSYLQAIEGAAAARRGVPVEALA
jgi:glycosyltransferase involved in cell wall biosynthesis